MNRYPALLVVLTTLAMFLSGAADLHAATKKKKQPVDTSDDAPAAEKQSSGPALDLPLPAKPHSSPAKSSASEKNATPDKSSESMKGSSSEKKAAGDAAPAEKSAERPGAEAKGKTEHAPNATVEPDEIAEFATQPPRIQQLLRDAVDLTRLNLTYAFGSADPDSGGMDCSGTIYYLLHAHGFADVPRDSSGQYMWARKVGAFFPVVSKSAESAEFKELLPGDLMFWTGTYETGRDIPISHVMLYLGREKGSGNRIMFGASDGRSYNGIQRWGVSIFDFKMPKSDPANPEKAKADFVGFARIPGLRSVAQLQAAATEPAAPPIPPKKELAATSKKASVKDSDASDDPPKKATPKPSNKKKKRRSDSD